MTIRDLISMDIDIDVYDDVSEELGIAFCGSIQLTLLGEKKFSEVMEYPVTIKNDIAIIRIDHIDEKVWKDRLHKAKEFFYAVAGYCSDSNYNKWFREMK